MSILELTAEIEYLKKLKENTTDSEQKLLSGAINQLDRLNGSIAVVIWLPDDVHDTLIANGYKPSDTNVERLLDQGLGSDLEDVGISQGWNVIESAVLTTEGLKNELGPFKMSEDLENGLDENKIDWKDISPEDEISIYIYQVNDFIITIDEIYCIKKEEQVLGEFEEVEEVIQFLLNS